jgi:hypothetical protein
VHIGQEGQAHAGDERKRRGDRGEPWSPTVEEYVERDGAR